MKMSMSPQHLIFTYIFPSIIPLGKRYPWHTCNTDSYYPIEILFANFVDEEFQIERVMDLIIKWMVKISIFKKKISFMWQKITAIEVCVKTIHGEYNLECRGLLFVTQSYVWE